MNCFSLCNTISFCKSFLEYKKDFGIYLFIVDILINNNDRNNGNWGVIYENEQYRLAPVYDNGAAFSNKLPEEKIQALINDDTKTKNSVLNSVTVYSKDGKKINARDIVKLQYDGLDAALTRTVPKTKQQMDSIRGFISNIPETYFDKATAKKITVCSSGRKNFYIKSMELQLENFLLPALEKAQERSGNIKDVKQEEIPKATSSLSDRDNKTSILSELKKNKAQQREADANNKTHEAKPHNKDQIL